MRRRSRRAWEKAYNERKKKRVMGRLTWSFVAVVLLFIMIFTAVLMRSGQTYASFLGIQKQEQDPITKEEVTVTPAAEESTESSVEEVKEDPVITGTDSANAEVVAPENIPDDQAAAWEESMLYKGDLILVNSEHAYNFDANADYLELVNLNSLDSFGHPLENDDMEVSGTILTYLKQMMDDCDAAVGSYDTSVSSAYRSLDYQQNVYDETIATNGEEYASQFVATPGYSEHHTGYAVDLGIMSDGYAQSFSESSNAEWVKENCYKYGFVRRYAEDKADITGISNEAWHFRYVGVPHATYMYENNLCLEEYIELLKGYTQQNPLTISCSTGDYVVFYTTSNKIWKPDYAYEVSGNNVDGYIVTGNVTGENT